MMHTTAGQPIVKWGEPADAADIFTLIGCGGGQAEAWQERALCAQTDPETFFPEKGGSSSEAKRICAGCPVKGECLEYALDRGERFGIYGGLSERERRKLKLRGSRLRPVAPSYGDHLEAA